MAVLCGVCGIKEFKYKCPRCLVQTCSLECSKKHKTRDNCSGQTHDPKEYISSEALKQADDDKHERNAYVQRDYNYLTQLKRMVHVQKMDARMKNKRVLGPVGGHNSNFKKRRYDIDEDDRDSTECQRIIRRGVNCLMLPKGMQRSSQNRSKWDKTMDLFVWSVEWILCPMQEKGEKKELFKHVSHRIKETDFLVQGMGKNVFQKCCEFYRLAGTSSCIEGEDGSETKEERTQILQKSGLKFYTKTFPYNTTHIMDSKKLVELAIHEKCIGELLKNTTVIEFPTIFVAMTEADLPEGYEVLHQEPRPLEHTSTLNKFIDNAREEEEAEEDSQPTEEPVQKETQDASDSDSDSDDDYNPGLSMDFLTA
ncbi:CAS_1a_G0023620.mRNA.1.CDS.1 [Saccharomyces cerevisiae]|nr:CAS_1a_G0023620.mRNA.1.CDS.1 [Saccharomyces cerevisiae]CAI7327333.1 CAS_1a_G0023620.mRNA.1.CDS.1 [Saccharomyces cerevisiae]